MYYFIKKLVCIFVYILILSLFIGSFVSASNSESDSNDFCTLYGFSYVEWDNYPRYYVDVISYTLNRYAYSVDQIQVVGDVFIDDVFIRRIDRQAEVAAAFKDKDGDNHLYTATKQGDNWEEISVVKEGKAKLSVDDIK